MKNCTDEELMSFVKNQDVSAFEELFQRYERRVFAFFCRLVWNAEEARDCTQDTFLQLWKARARYAPKGRFSTYIFQIAKNHFLHECRRRKSKITLEQTSRVNTQGRLEEKALPDSTYGRAVANEVQAAISKAVTGLPETHRLVYVLSEEQRLSYQEISDVLGCPVGTVSSRKVEAVRKLRKMLEPLREELFGNGPQVSSVRNVGKNRSEVSK
jgi:RNA polymerase sigma-70 factor (ECF subfamily)